MLVSRIRTTAACTAVVALVASAAAAQQGRRPASNTCDRTCLTGIANAYLAALVAHDPSKAPLADTVTFTEQAQPLAVGQGLWQTTAAGPTKFKIIVPDPVSGQVGVMVMMKADMPAPPQSPAAGARASAPPAGPVPIQLALRLKVEARRITEAEHIIAQVTNPAQLANLETPRPAFFATVPVARRLPRALMLIVANSYYDALSQNNADLTPFAADCDRRENGMHTAGKPLAGESPGPLGALQGCREQIESRAMSYITSIDLRRVQIADPEKGLVFGLTMFRQPMAERSVTIVNPDGTTTKRPMNYNPFDLEAAHIFKIAGGQIHEIEAMGFVLPLNSKNGWNSFVR